MKNKIIKRSIRILFFIVILYFLPSPLCEFSNFVVISIPLQGEKSTFFKIFDEIPPFFDDYTVKHIHESIDEKTREGLYTLHIKSCTPGYPIIETTRKFKLDTDYICIRNAFVNGRCIFGRDNNFISLIGQDTARMKYPVIVKHHFYSAICLAHINLLFGSLFYNIFFPILAIPEEAIKKSVLIVSMKDKSTYQNCVEMYSTIFDNKHVYSLEENEYAMVDELHTLMNPTPGIQHYATALYNFSILFRKKFNLTAIKPTEYAFINRGYKFKRHISNLREIINAARKTMPQYKWKEFKDIYPTICSGAKVWASIKVLFTITGSNLVRCVALSPRTAMCVVFADRFDWEVIAVAESINVFLYVLPVLSIEHFCYSQNNVVDVSLAIKALNATVYAEKNQRWSAQTLKENENNVTTYVPNPGFTMLEK